MNFQLSYPQNTYTTDLVQLCLLHSFIVVQLGSEMIELAQVVQTLDSTIQRINHYPAPG